MAIPVNIKDLVHANTVESSRIEFKAGFNPNAIIHTICAFANDIDNIGGGYIVIGIEEERGLPLLPPEGISREEVDDILKKLIGFCHCIEPLYNPIVEPVEYDGRTIIVIWVSGGHGRPYKACKDVFSAGSAKYYYIRKMSSTVVASPEEEKELFYVSSDIPFDDRPNLLASVDDLDRGLILEHLRQVGSTLYDNAANLSTFDLAQNLQLISGPPENLRPLNVGLLMFSESPEKYFRYARIEVVIIPDPTGEGMIERVFTGPIQRQLKNALAYLRNMVVEERVTKTSDQPEAGRTVNYPFAAVEEILSNAVYHRSYQINEPIVVRVQPDSIEITSFPGFDRSISDEAIADGRIRARVYRNRRIGDFLKELRLIEGRNTGFPTAFKALEENGSPTLQFDTDENRGYLSVTIPIHETFLLDKKGDQKREDYINRVKEALEEKPLSLTELAHAMGYRSITKKLSVTVEQLEKCGELERIPAAQGSRVLLKLL